jgi:hypothetical protein
MDDIRRDKMLRGVAQLESGCPLLSLVETWWGTAFDISP